MKHIIYEDARGFLRRVLVKDNDSVANASRGLPAYLDIEKEVDWEAVKKEVNNVLIQQGVFTWENANSGSVGMQAAITVFKRHLIGAFKRRELETRNKSGGK